ncbi:MAG: PriCT-2 domain-containing protein [Lascolabacillus sp.]|jgi:hypothetical protein|nr:PriCT-2 domain-containing protein [Lascolabacillus sp.]
MNVSIYKNITDTIGVSGQLISFLTTDKWQNLSIQVRNETNKEIRNQLKRRLPCCTPSGLFKKRNKAYLIKHSGYICIDIDEEDNPSINDWQGFITELGHLKETVFAGLSVSGRGAFSLIQISDIEHHELHFKALEEDYLRYGIIIDHACKDVSRLRIYSYNEQPYINCNASVYTRKYKPRKINNSFYSGTQDVDKLVAKIVYTNTNIVPDYKSWFEVAGALANVNKGRELFHAISSVDPTKYNPKKCDKQFDKVRAGAGINVNTLFYHAKLKGVTLK